MLSGGRRCLSIEKTAWQREWCVVFFEWVPGGRGDDPFYALALGCFSESYTIVVHPARCRSLGKSRGSLLLVTDFPPASELFSFWIVLFPPTLPQAILQAEQQLLRRFWFVWHQQAAVCQLERQQQAMAIAHHHSGLLRRAFCIWKESTQGFRIE